MGALLGFIVGYVAGAKAGPHSIDELRKAWETIASSEEVRGLLAAFMSSVQGLVQQNAGTVAEQVRGLAAGNEALLEKLGADNGNLADVWKQITQSRELEVLITNGTQLIGAMLAQSAAAMSKQPTPRH